MTKTMSRMEALLKGFKDSVSLEFQKKRIERKLEAKKDELEEQAYDIQNELNEAISILVSNSDNIGEHLSKVSEVFCKQEENQKAQEQLNKIVDYLKESIEINEEEYQKKLYYKLFFKYDCLGMH